MYRARFVSYLNFGFSNLINVIINNNIIVVASNYLET